jgi:hypothetical protein
MLLRVMRADGQYALFTSTRRRAHCCKIKLQKSTGMLPHCKVPQVNGTPAANDSSSGFIMMLSSSPCLPNDLQQPLAAAT